MIQPTNMSASVRISPTDIRELQPAEGAIVAGVDLLLRQWGATKADLSSVYLAGAFGNYITDGHR